MENKEFKTIPYLDDSELQAIQEQNLKDRIELLELCSKNPEFQAQIVQKCKEDVLFWIKYFCCTFDPRPEAGKKHLPFIPYEFQDISILEVKDKILKGEDLLIEKSRDMGATWFILYIFQWLWQFHDGYSFHLGSKKEDNVDKIGDISTLFEKLRYNINRQPAWLLPKYFLPEKNTSFLKIINPSNSNAITGESSNANFARSGRYSAILFDEFAHWEQAYPAWAAASESTRCRIALSTPYGKGNKFASLRWNSIIKVLTLYWYYHPRKTKNLTQLEDGSYTSDWYEYEKTRNTKSEMAKEIDIDYQSSKEGAVYLWNSKINVVKGLLQQILNNPNYKDIPITRVWDFGLHPAVIFIMSTPFGMRVLRELIPLDRTTLSRFIPSVLFTTNQYFSGRTIKDRCDVAGRQTSAQTGKTSIEILNAENIYPESEMVPIEDGILVVQSLIDKPDGMLVDSECKITIEAFEGGYYRPEDQTGQGKEMSPVQVHPYEEPMDCIRYEAYKNYKPQNPNYEKNKQKSIQQALNTYEEYEI